MSPVGALTAQQGLLIKCAREKMLVEVNKYREVYSSWIISVYWSPRWSSGYPRLLLELVREFDSHRGEVLTLFVEMPKYEDDQLLRAPSSVGRYNSTRVDEGRRC